MSRFPSGGTISLRELIFEVQVDPEEFLAQLRGGKFEPVQRDGPTLSYRFRTSEMRDVFWRDFREYEAGRRKRMSQRRENAIISLFGGVAAGVIVNEAERLTERPDVIRTSGVSAEQPSACLPPRQPAFMRLGEKLYNPYIYSPGGPIGVGHGSEMIFEDGLGITMIAVWDGQVSWSIESDEIALARLVSDSFEFQYRTPLSITELWRGQRLGAAPASEVLSGESRFRRRVPRGDEFGIVYTIKSGRPAFMRVQALYKGRKLDTMRLLYDQEAAFAEDTG